MPNAFRILKPIQKSSKHVSYETRLPKTKCVWPMKINILYITFIKEHICDQRFVHDFLDFIYYVIGTERYDTIDYILRNIGLNCVSSDILHVEIGADMPV